jgi:hypothetical protein
MCVGQADKTPLDAFAEGAAIDGIATRIGRKVDNGEGYRLIIDRILDIANELSLELPFIRSRQKMKEIRAFLEHLERPRALERNEIRRAREVASELDFSSAPSRRAMDPMDRANWHETEGCLSVGPRAFQSKSGAALLVSQFEIEPLKDFMAGCAIDGITCHLYRKGAETGVEYFVRIRRQDQIALELSKEMPYLRTKKSVNQIQAFVNYIWMPRKHLTRSLELARRVSGREPIARVV